MAQDAAIQSKFLASWSTTLNVNLGFATKARKGVTDSRLALDAAKGVAKTKATGATEGDVGSPAIEKARSEMEKREDEFVAQTEEAEGVMKNVGLRASDLCSRKSTLTTRVLGPRHPRAIA